MAFLTILCVDLLKLKIIMKNLFTLLLSCSVLFLQAQSASITGVLHDEQQEPVQFSNVILYQTADSSLVKVEPSDEKGKFRFAGLNAGNYYLVATYVGLADLKKMDLILSDEQTLDLGVLAFQPTAIELAGATVTATRAMVEVKPDRTVFNVQGTINSTGADAIELLRKAPGVMVDNNDNINVLGRAGVLLYVDGKRLPLTGADLTAYLQNLPADQIDRFDIITNPGAKYEAEGNAGIIDIRLKKDENLGANGSLNATGSKGRFYQYNMGGSVNYRNKKMNTFASAGYSNADRFSEMFFKSEQNDIFLNESNEMNNGNENINYRVGTDFFIGKNQTLGFLVGGNYADNNQNSTNRIEISPLVTRTSIDSILVANVIGRRNRNQNTFNLNYSFSNKSGRSLNLDADYGKYTLDSEQQQPNRYFDEKEEILLTEVINAFETPSEIDIYTFKADFEEEVMKGKLGLGTKFSKIVSDNTFLFFNEINGQKVLNDQSSNEFTYDETVYAAYATYARPINQKWSFSAGLRTELTDARGELTPFAEENREPPVEQNYLSWFPSAGLTWQMNRTNVFSLNYGRRINRPDYNVLNPFDNKLSELSSEKGNPNLRPEIVNNIELGYTLAYRYNFKIAYSKTDDQITRLIAPATDDLRAGFITWDNLASQTVVNFSASVPVQVNKWWSLFINANASYIDNQADYGNGAVVDVQVFSYTTFQQHTFTLPKGFKGEISGWYSGPGVWGGVFEYDSNWSLNLGLQKKFLNDQLNVRVSANDIFYQTGWSGISEFNGLVSTGRGNWDSRRVSLSLGYNFGNQKVKSRKRKTGIEAESKRVGS